MDINNTWFVIGPVELAAEGQAQNPARNRCLARNANTCMLLGGGHH